MQNAVRTGDFVLAGLQRLKQKYGNVGEVRNKGLFFAVEVVTDRESKTPAGEMAARIVESMLAQKILISRVGRDGAKLKMRPPMPFDTEHAEFLLAALERAFASL